MRASLHNHPTSGPHTTCRRSSRLQFQTPPSHHQQQHHRSSVSRRSSNGDTQQPVLVKQWSDLFSQFLAADQLPASSIHNDALSQAQQQLQQAAEVEDYETAAQLRDGSLAWLGGWYRPAANPQARGVNSSSSLLYVSHTETNRWTGLLFTPADFMHFDLQGNCNMSELQMDDMLQQPRYGTPLFEVFVLPQAQQHQQADDSVPAAIPTSTAPTPPSDGSAAIPSSAPSTPSTPAAANTYSSSTFMPVVVALQSANRAFNELLGVQPSRRRDPAAPNQPRLVNQRLMLLVQQHSITAAAVHAGNDATLWTWHISTAPAEHTTHPNTDSSSCSSTSTSTAHTGREGQSSAGSVVSGPLRPAGASGGCRSGLTIDQYSIDHLRGPGSLARSGPDSFTFCRQPLPADVLSVLCSGSNCGSSGGWDGSGVQLFRVDLQYSLPPVEPAEATKPGADAADDPAAAAAAAAAGSQQEAAASSDSGSSSSDNSWAQRVAAEVCALLNKQQVSSSSSSTGLQQSLAELLAAAAVGSAPPGGAVSEVQQAVGVVEVQLGGSSSDEATATPPAVEFVRVVEPTATLSFGGWQVTASLT